jgi:hypothetical protein
MKRKMETIKAKIAITKYGISFHMEPHDTAPYSGDCYYATVLISVSGGVVKSVKVLDEAEE